MGEIDGAGEIVTGGLLARAVEPHAGEAGGDHGGICLNCGTALVGDFCHVCGQSGHVHRSLAAIGHEILHGVAHFEGKLWRTLPMLVWRPGELTRRYIEGERARFVSPMAFFLFSIFTMFAVFSIVGIAPPIDLPNANGVTATLSEARDKILENRKDAVADRAEADASAAQRAKADARIAEFDRQLAALAQVHPENAAAAMANEPHTGWAQLDHGIEKWQKNPALMLYKLQSSSYKFSWLLIPLSLPFVWLLFFWRRDLHLYDHMTFVTYSIAFMSLLFVVLAIASTLGLGSGWISLFGTSIPLAHLYRHLKGSYRLGTASAVLRTLLLVGFVGVVLALFFLALLALGIFG